MHQRFRFENELKIQKVIHIQDSQTIREKRIWLRCYASTTASMSGSNQAGTLR